jgi:hypothetical protein
MESPFHLLKCFNLLGITHRATKTEAMMFVTLYALCSRAEWATRGSAISFVMLASNALSDSFFVLFLAIHESWQRARRNAVPYSTV